MTYTISSDGYTVSTLCEKRQDGVRVYAFCPICDKAEETDYNGNDGKQAVTISIGKIRIHMHLVHRVKNHGDLRPARPDAV